MPCHAGSTSNMDRQCLYHAQGLIFNEMRAKTKVIQEPLGLNPKDYPDWSFDGSSTGQAEGNNSDCILKYGPPHLNNCCSVNMRQDSSHAQHLLCLLTVPRYLHMLRPVDK